MVGRSVVMVGDSTVPKHTGAERGRETIVARWPETERCSQNCRRRRLKGRTDRRQGGPACPYCCTPPGRCSWAPR